MATGEHPTRVHADFNGRREPARTGRRPAVALDTLGTLRELTNAGLRPAEGVRLTAYDWSDEDEAPEAAATVRYDADDGPWWAELGRGG